MATATRASGPAVNDGKVETLNITPGAGGTRIDASRYESVRKAILKAVPKDREGVAFTDLADLVRGNLPGGEIPGGGAIKWYTTVVKLDLEARGLIERVPGAKPQRLTRA